jgi:hypothetical protein
VPFDERNEGAVAIRTRGKGHGRVDGRRADPEDWNRLSNGPERTDIDTRRRRMEDQWERLHPGDH